MRIVMNDFDLFETIWDNAVIPTCREYINKYDVVDHTERSKNKIKRCFYEETQFFIHSYMIDETRNIDRHKIASCMVKAILIAKPLRVSFFNKVKQLFKKIELDDVTYLINQYLSMNVAILILEGYIRSDVKKEIKHKIFIPEPFPEGQKNYMKDVCLDLYYTKPKKINTITYANIFFLWEKYSCRRVQCSNLENECKKLMRQSGNFSEEDLQSKIDEIRYRSQI